MEMMIYFITFTLFPDFIVSLKINKIQSKMNLLICYAEI